MLNSNSKVNAINPDFTWKLGFHIWKINIRAQMINNSTLKTFEIVITDFQVEDKGNRSRLFQEIFLIADNQFEIILRMFFLKIRNAEVLFGKRTLMWKSYITNKTLSTTKQIQTIDLKKFVIAALDVDNKTFLIYVATQKQEKIAIDFVKKT